MDRLQAMQTFVRVVEAGSFTAVAKELHSTQSAISKQVAALERVLGGKLLSRTTRSLALTEDGERYFEHARRLVAEVAEAESTLRRGEQQLSGWLRVAASVAYGRRVLMPLVRSFLVAHPRVRIDLKLNDGFVDLVEQGVDMAIRVGELPDSSLVARRIGTTHRALMASRRYARTLPDGLMLPREPTDLLLHNCIVYTELATGNVWTFVSGRKTGAAPGAQQSIRAQGNLQTNSSEAIREAVLGDMGISYSPIWLFRDEIKSGEVITLMPHWVTPSIPINLVSPPQRSQAAKVMAFGAHLAGALKQE